ncbi:hypothetical protein MUK42_36010 [Musa troglodytarum]|uniref:Uncharacterized protein n=1 Tax=Musa troglodytarum TaxID=320322 RepID=A0A9E7G4M7_9LILI|nr:hypothetical protein MUK42_36010 [Musa troglodytarum]
MATHGEDKKLLKENKHVEFVQRWNLLNYKLEKKAMYFLRSSDHDLYAIHTLVYEASQKLEASITCFNDPPFPWESVSLFGVLLFGTFVEIADSALDKALWSKVESEQAYGHLFYVKDAGTSTYFRLTCFVCETFTLTSSTTTSSIVMNGSIGFSGSANNVASGIHLQQTQRNASKLHVLMWTSTQLPMWKFKFRLPKTSRWIGGHCGCSACSMNQSLADAAHQLEQQLSVKYMETDDRQFPAHRAQRPATL